MKEYLLIDETFDRNLSKTYDLFVQLGLNELLLCVFDTVQSKFVLYKSFKIDNSYPVEDLVKSLSKIVSNEELFLLDYSKVKILKEEEKISLIPDELADPVYLKKNLDFTGKIYDYHSIYFNKINQISAQVAFTIHSYVTDVFSRVIKNPKFYCQYTTLIEICLSEQQVKAGAALVGVNIRNHYIDVVVCANKKVVLANSFHYRNSNDMVYFIANVYEQLKLSREQIPCVVCGDFEKDSSAFKLLSNYIAHINLVKLPAEMSFSYKMRSLEAHKIINLIMLNKCE